METKTKGIGFDQSATLHLSQGKKILFGIGINTYRSKPWNPLNNAVRDVEEMAALLRTHYGFDEVKLLKNEEATRSNIEEGLYRLTRSAALGEYDSLVIYYSGHGHLDENDKGYWVPVDADKDKIATYLPNSRIRELISDLKCKHVLLISDACFSGSFFVEGVRGSDIGEVADEYEKRVSRWAFCSGRHDEVVSDGPPGRHSPFASAIIEELRLNDYKKLNIARLADKVIEITRSNYRQMPEANPIQDVGHRGGQFVFTPQNYVLKPIPDPVRYPNPDLISFPEPVIPFFKRNAKLIGLAAVLLVALLSSGIAYLNGMFGSGKPMQPWLSLTASFNKDTIESGQPQQISFRLKNEGNADARLKPMEFSTQDLNMENNHEISIAPGVEKEFKVAWTPQSSGAQTVRIKITGDNLIRDTFMQVAVFVRDKISKTPHSRVDTNTKKEENQSPPSRITQARIIAPQSAINIGDIEVGESKRFSFNLNNEGGRASSELSISSCEDVLIDESGGINGHASKQYYGTWQAGHETGRQQCALTVQGHPVKIVITANIFSKKSETESVLTDIPKGVKMWLITDDRKRIDAINGVFEIPKTLRGRLVKVYFEKNGKQDWKNVNIGTGEISLPDGF